MSTPFTPTPGAMHVRQDPARIHDTLVCNGDLETVAVVPDWKNCPGRGVANAIRFAATSEMLEALEQIIEWRDLVRQNYPDMAGLLRGIDAGIKAVAKAKGEAD